MTITKYKWLPWWLVITLWPIATLATSEDDEINQFIQRYLPDTAQKSYLWLTGDRKTVSKQILNHAYYKIRAPYWQAKDANQSRSAKTLWLLEEVGKEKRITIGIVIEEQAIQAVRIVKFRESRGWEVKLPSFTQQFTGSQLDGQNQLTQTIDGISGATLSVRAVTHIARLALYLQSTLPNP